MRLPAVPRLDRALASCADGASAAIVAACLCGSLLTAPPRAALAVDGAAALAEPAALTSSKAVSGNVADETWALIDKYYLDRTFNGLDWKGERQRLQKMEPMDDKQALEEAEKLVSSLGDKYSRVLDPVNAAKLNKYDVTGVGLNLIISDNGDMKVGAKPAPDSEAARAGIQFGELVLSINSQPTKGMTSFDALEAIQGEGRTVEITVKAADAEARQLTLTKAFVVKDPVKTRLVRTNDGKDAVGYIKLGEFNARCKKRVAEAIDELQAAGATEHSSAQTVSRRRSNGIHTRQCRRPCRAPMISQPEDARVPLAAQRNVQAAAWRMANDVLKLQSPRVALHANSLSDRLSCASSTACHRLLRRGQRRSHSHRGTRTGCMQTAGANHPSIRSSRPCATSSEATTRRSTAAMPCCATWRRGPSSSRTARASRC